MKPFTIFTDNAHGWLRVSYSDIADLNLTSSQFSKYSYYDTAFLYLEEDCDASKFLSRFVKKHGAMPVIHDSHTNGQSSIRRKARL